MCELKGVVIFKRGLGTNGTTIIVCTDPFLALEVGHVEQM